MTGEGEGIRRCGRTSTDPLDLSAGSTDPDDVVPVDGGDLHDAAGVGRVDHLAVADVDADVADKLIKKDDAPEHVLTEEQSIKIKAIFDKAINKPAYRVELESLNPDELPVTVTMDEFMRRMKDMAAMGGGMGFYGNMPDNYKVIVNGNHKLISRILEGEDEAVQAQLAKQAFDLALLSQGLLTGAELTEFVNRSVSLI
jgi:molecular chaperone HtpG